MPITWRNVGTTNPAALLNAGTAAAEQLGDGISDIGTGIDQYADARTTRETNAFLTELMQAPDQGARDNMINDANTAFLNMETINTENYTLGQPERDKQVKIEDETRATTQAKELFTFEDDIADKNLIAKTAADKDVLNYQDGIFDANYNIENTDQVAAAQLKYTNDQSLIVQEHEKALERLKESKASDASIRLSLDKAEKAHKLELQKLADQYKLDEKKAAEDRKIAAAELKRELNKTTGIGAIIEAQSGKKDSDGSDIGMESDDFGAFASRRNELAGMGIPKDKIDKWVAENVVFNDNIAGGFNDFSFIKDGKSYDFGKLGQSQTDDLEAMRTAILNFENDLAQRAEASKLYSEKFPERRDFDAIWFEHDKKMLDNPNNAETFMAELVALTQ